MHKYESIKWTTQYPILVSPLFFLCMKIYLYIYLQCRSSRTTINVAQL